VTRPSTFARYVDRLEVVAAAEAAGLERTQVLQVIAELDDAVAAVDGHGFAVTPFLRQRQLADAVGLDASASLWVKDETGNVSGSHKGRHLFGVALGLALNEALSARSAPLVDEPDRLAIASCGNAALAAAVIAAASHRPLDVFVPDWADRTVTDEIERLGASVVRCARRDGRLGDPAYHAMVEALDAGATGFSCQGTDTPTTIDGARTLAYEMLDQVDSGLDRLVIQVGGGALATALVTGLRLGADAPLPIVHAVQPDGNHPLVRAWDRVMAELAGQQPSTNRERQTAAANLGPATDAVREAVMARLQANPDRYMEPWPVPPVSYATGILDDVTYDWVWIIDAMLASGGFPVVVDDPDFRAAHRLGQEQTGIAVCPTGASGLAGLLVLTRQLGMTFAGEQVALVFSGHQRAGDPAPNGALAGPPLPG